MVALPVEKEDIQEEKVSALDLVMTVQEIAEAFDLESNVVRITIKNRWLPEGTYRKSGGTWLVLRSAAVQRWGQGGTRRGPKRKGE